MARNKIKSDAPQTTAQQLGSLIKSARDIMRKDKGLNGDLDRLPMLTWVMFLKFLDDMEVIRGQEAALDKHQRYKPAIENPYRWRDWAAKEDGITGDILRTWIEQDEAIGPDGKRCEGLLAYLRNLQGNGTSRRDVIANVFRNVRNRMESGYLLREVINKVTHELVGACALVTTTRPRLLLCDKVFRFKFHNDGRLIPAYLNHVLKSSALREQIEAGASGTSPTMKNISKAKILQLSMPFPPIAEQLRAVEYLDGLQAKVDRLKELQARTAAELDALLPSILDKAFRGELVTAEPAFVGDVQMAAVGALFPEAVQAIEDEYATDLAVAVLTLNDRVKRGHQTREFHQQKVAFLAKAVLRLPVQSTFYAKAAGPWSQDLRQAFEAKPTRERWFALPRRRGDVG